MTTRIAIYGGTNLPPKEVQFVRCLTRNLITIHDVILVSGGFKCFKEYPDRISVDLAVLREAKQFINQSELFNL